jgi:hypothetical protein
MLQKLVVDILDQLSFHIVCTILVHRLLDRIAKPVLRVHRVDSAVAALNIFALEAVWASPCIAIRVTGIFAKKISSRSNHVRLERALRVYWRFQKFDLSTGLAGKELDALGTRGKARCS